MRILRLRALAGVVVVAAALLGVASAGAQSSPPDGIGQASFFSPCTFQGSGPPPIDTCTNTTPAVTAVCDPAGISTIDFTTSGYLQGSAGGSFTETVHAVIGPQDGPAAPAFQPFSFTGLQVGSIGLPTGPLLSYDATFSLTTNDGTTISGTKSLVADLANNGVCLNLNDQVPPSNVFGGAMTGYFYILDAQVLSYQSDVGDGAAEAYLSDGFGTYSFDPSLVSTSDGAYVSGFGTTHPATGTTTSAPTPTGTGVDVVPAAGVDVKFSTVSGDGTTSATELSTVPPLPTGFSVGDPPLYYDISTDATFTGPVEVCVPYGTAPAGTTPQLLHYDNGAWVDVTTGFNDATRIVCGSVTSFSPFAAVFEPLAPTTKAQCMNGGWKRYTNPAFKNQGDCVSYVATKGKNSGNG